MRAYLLTALVAAAVTWLLVPVVRRAAVAAHVMTPVRDRDVHAHPVPRGGGVAMLGGFAAALLVASRLPLFHDVFTGSSDPQALLSGAGLITLLGIADDKWGLDPLTKLAGQCVSAGVMVLQGVQVFWLPLPGQETYVLTPTEGTALTVLVVVVLINAVNFVDGLDGLAAGIMMIAATAFFVASYQLWVDAGVVRAGTSTLTTAALAGVCAGFLPHNFHPARVFMGDTGAMLLGLLFAASVVSLTGQLDPGDVNAQRLFPALLPLTLPVVVVLIPLLDLGLAVVRRTWAGRSPFAADKRHLHHRLLEIGHSHRRAVLIMYAWSALVAFGTVLLSRGSGLATRAALGAAVVVALVLTLGANPWRGIRRDRLVVTGHGATRLTALVSETTSSPETTASPEMTPPEMTPPEMTPPEMTPPEMTRADPTPSDPEPETAPSDATRPDPTSFDKTSFDKSVTPASGARSLRTDGISGREQGTAGMDPADRRPGESGPVPARGAPRGP